MVNAEGCSVSLTSWFLFTTSVVVVFLFLATSLAEEIALVWQAARVVAIAKAQAKRKEIVGKDEDMIGSTYIKGS
jgi:hypothetical protein